MSTSGAGGGISVLTLARGRADRLVWLIEGLARQTRLPDELVIAFMQDAPDPVPDAPFPIVTITVPGEPMPLAAARNRAAAAARAERLVFLDVDCIPSPRLVERYADALDAHDRLLLGEVRYLPAGGTDGGIAPDALDAVAIVHPARPVLAGHAVVEEPDHNMLWGLSFALRRERWAALGGMDEAFVGYGAEETDFACRYAAAGGRMAWVGGARAWHQHHAVHIPPLQHFDAILRNARLFRARHSRWCMDYWLGQFRDRGFIAWDEDAITVLRTPTAEEVAASRQGDEVAFS